MEKFSNPVIWLRRFRHRKGYGVHSPFAYQFLRGVVYETNPYYIYNVLDSELPTWHRFRIRRHLHLLTRCVNWHQPRLIVVPTAGVSVMKYLRAGCRKAECLRDWPEGEVDFCFLEHPDDALLQHIGKHTLLVMDNLRQHREWFDRLPSVVSMDLWDIGIAFFDPHYNKQHYIVNF